MPSLLRRVLCTSTLFAAALTWTTIAFAGITVTTDPDASTWPQPETHNVVAVDGQPKIEIVPDAGTNGLYDYFLESVDLSGGKVASQIFKPTTNFKLGAIGFYADGVGTFDTSTPAVDDHIPLTVHLYELVSGTTGAGSLPTSYDLSTAGGDNSSAVDLFGELPFTYNGVPAFTYEFVELNFSGEHQINLVSGSTYAIEIWGNSLTGALNLQRMAVGSPGGTNPYADGDSYIAANSSLSTARTRPQSASRDLLMAIYEAIPTEPNGHPGDFDLDGDVDGADFVAWQTNFPKASGASLSQGDADEDGDVDGADFVVWQTNFPFTPTVAHPGDFDSDGDVDGADFVAWQTHFPTAANATLADGDADGDGDVDGADFVVWQTNFPFTPGPGVSPVPEPAAFLVAALAIPAIARVARQRHCRQRHCRRS